jgi:hypothetical protein
MKLTLALLRGKKLAGGLGRDADGTTAEREGQGRAGAGYRGGESRFATPSKNINGARDLLPVSSRHFATR